MIYLIIFVGLILRSISLNQSFWLDEATSANVAKNFSFDEIITKFSVSDFHPPLYYLTLKAWSIPFGVSEVSARLLSVLFALGTIYITYLISKKLFNKSIAIVNSLLLATAPLHIYYSQEARMYSMQTFFVGLAVYAYMHILNKAKAIWWIIFSLSIVLIAATDYLPLLVVPVFWVYSLISRKSLSWFSKFILSHIPLALFFAFWSPILTKQLSSGLSVQADNPAWWRTLGQSGLKELVLLPVKFMLGRISFENNLTYALVVCIVGLAFGWLMFKAFKEIKKTSVFWLWLILPIVLAFTLGFFVSVFSYFRLLFVLPAFYILIGYGSSKVKESVFPFAFMFLVLINSAFSWMYLSNQKFHREDWRGAVAAISSECVDKNCAVVFPSHSQQEAYRYYANTQNLVKSEDLDATHDLVWFVKYVADISDPQGLTQKKIESLDYKMTEEKNFNGVVVWKYKNENRN